MEYVLYDCDICGGTHEWGYNGDCRNNSERYVDAEDYAARRKVNIKDIEVRDMEERVEADLE